MRRFILLLCGFLAYQTMNAESVSKSEALRKAQSFMPGKHFVESKSVASTRGETSSDAFYVFNADNGGGYVIVSGDDRTTEILGYSRTGNLDMDRLPENLKWWLDGYVRQIKALGTSVKPVKTVKTRGVGEPKEAIEPLIKTKWDQDFPYNMWCPDDQGREREDAGFATDDKGVYSVSNICVTGCVATAMAQIMYFWQYPATCPAIDGYNTDSHGWTMDALEGTTFKWTQMKETYNGNEEGETVEAIAELFRYCGQAVGMDYDMEGSEASVSSRVLAKVFGYSKNIRELYRDPYSTSQWEDMVYGELAAGRPVLYSGKADIGGHEFIVDGYDGNGLFHMNWGWGGMSDDYFVLSLADPKIQGAGGANSAFQFDQSALFGVEPGNSEEVLTPQIKSDISKMATETYNRASISSDFTGVQLNGAFYINYNIEPTENSDVLVGWALCQNGQDKFVVYSKSYTIGAGKTGYYTNTEATFGTGIPTGKYEVCQVYRYTEDDAWSLCDPYWNPAPYTSERTAFLVAEVTETTLTIRQVQPSFKVNSINVPEYPSTGNALDVTVNVTNNGETYEQVVRLWAKEGEAAWSHVATTTRRIDIGESGDIVLSYTPTKSGTYTLKVTDGSSDTALETATVAIYASYETTLNNIKYVCHSGTKKAKVIGNELPLDSPVDVSIPASFPYNGNTYTVTEIADGAFSGCSSMAKLTIPSTVESIGNYAIYNCFRLTELNIPEGVNHIGEGAFMYCFYLKTLSLPSTLQSIGDYAFANDGSLQTVQTAMANPCAIDRSVFTVEETVNGEVAEGFSKASLFIPIGKKEVYTAADVWNKFPNIYQGELKETTQNDITYTYVTGEDVAIVKKGDEAALANMDVVIPSMISIDGKTYNVKKIAEEAFIYVAMKSLTIQPGVEEIGDYAFYGAYSFTFTQVVIPEGVKHIGASAFEYCVYLESLELPATLTSIGENAFANIHDFNTVVSYIINPFAIADNVFGTLNSETVLSVPAGCKATYENTAGWRNFPKIIQRGGGPGDINDDNEFDDEDLNAIVGYIMAGEYEKKADLNNDNKVDAADIVEFVKKYKNQ